MEMIQTTRTKPETIDTDDNGAVAIETFCRRCVRSPRYFLENLTDIPDIKSNGLVPFRFNHAQQDYYHRIWQRGVLRDIMAKARKWGFSTLRSGLGFHRSLYTEGHISRVVAHRQRTAEELNRTVKGFYDSAMRNLRTLGIDPSYLLPEVKYDNKREYFFPATSSAFIVDTARGKGVGQSDRSDDLYITEYSEWDDAADKRAALIGSIPLGSGGRATIDFNAKGMGNDAYDMYQAARLGEAAEGWNGYVATFFGIRQSPDIYSADMLEAAARELGSRFPALYPSNDEELWLADEKAVHRPEDILACGDGAVYLVSRMSEAQIKECEVFHGIDTATGGGPDWQVMKSRAIVDGILREIEEPIRTQLPEDIFSDMAWERWNRWGGMMTVESNQGMAVLLRFKQLGVPANGRLFRRKDPLNPGKSKAGFATTYASKRVMIADYDSLLREHAIDLPSQNHRNELRIFQWVDDHTLASAPALAGKHDDEVMADYLLVQGLRRAAPASRAIEKIL